MDIFVGNLPFKITEQEISDAFSQFGEVARIKMLTDKMDGRFRGIAFVTMTNDEAAKTAIKELDGKELSGRALRVNEARGPEERSKEGGNGFSRPRSFDRGGFGGGNKFGGGPRFGGGGAGGRRDGGQRFGGGRRDGGDSFRKFEE